MKPASKFYQNTIKSFGEVLGELAAQQAKKHGTKKCHKPRKAGEGRQLSGSRGAHVLVKGVRFESRY